MITHDLRVMADAMLDKKAQNVVDIDLRQIGTAITDHFMICNGDSTTNVNAIADSVIEKMRTDIIAHIFLTEYRAFYRLEELWADAPRKEYKERRKPASKTKKTEEDA